MKKLGNILIVIGIILMSYSILFMDVSVEVEHPEGLNTDIPSRVNNLGLMADRQNYLIVASVFIIVGLILRYLPEQKNITEIDKQNKKCPECAEQVKYEAKICRFCNYKFLDKEYLVTDKNNLDKYVQENETTEKINDETLNNLYNLIKSEQKSLFGGYSKKVAEELIKICQTKNDTLNLMWNFKNKYNSELIDEISKLSNHINYLRRNLEIFIDFEIIENEYPFKRKI